MLPLVREHELGGSLLERGARGVATTESGKVLLARARWLLGMVDDIKAEVRTENREPSGTVRLGAPPSLADILYAPLAKIFVEGFPRVRLELSEGLTEALSDRLLRAELDIAIVTMPQPVDHLDYETLVVEQLFLIGPARDPLLRGGRLTLKAFNAIPAAVRPLSRSPFPPGVPSSLSVDGVTPMKRIVAAGLGYGLLPLLGFHQEIAAGILSAALVPWMRADRVMALPRAQPVSHATREVVVALKDVCRELIGVGMIQIAPGRARSIRADE